MANIVIERHFFVKQIISGKGADRSKNYGFGLDFQYRAINFNVGIGTTGPGVKLDVAGGDIALQTAQKLVLDSNDTGDTSNTYFTHDATNNWISYYIDGTEAMRIKKR